MFPQCCAFDSQGPRKHSLHSPMQKDPSSRPQDSDQEMGCPRVTVQLWKCSESRV